MFSNGLIVPCFSMILYYKLPCLFILLHLFFLTCRSVVIVGDVNASHRRIDHCDPSGNWVGIDKRTHEL